MSIGAHQFFNALGEKTVYVNSREPNVIQWLDGTQPETCGHRPTIAEFLAGYGFTSRKPADRVAEGEVAGREPGGNSHASIAAQATSKDLVLFADDKERDRARNKGLALEPRHLDADLLDSAETSRGLVETLGLAQDGGVPTGKIDKYQLQFLLGGWLEVFLWGLLDRHQEPLGIWDVRLGLEPMGLDSEVPNDFDVSFMHQLRPPDGRVQDRRARSTTRAARSSTRSRPSSASSAPCTSAPSWPRHRTTS